MKRVTIKLAAIGTALAVAVLGTGCNAQWLPYAARVGSAVVTPAQLDAAMHDASTDAGFRCLLERTSSAGYRLEGSGTNTYDSAFSAFVLTNLIDAQVAHAVVSDAKIAEPSSARSLASSQVQRALSSQLTSSQCGVATSNVLKQLGPTLSRSFVQLQLDEDALAAHAAHVSLTTAGITAYEKANPGLTKQSCIAGVFLRTKAIANKVVSQLRHGTSFASIVTKYSPNSASTGGALGCYTSAQLAQISPAVGKAVAPARIGAVIKPVAYQTAYLVLRVTSRPFEALVDALDQLFTSYSQAFSTSIAARVKRLAVQVNPEYGSWTTAKQQSGTSAAAGFGGRVRPFSGPSLAYVLNGAAIKGPLHQAAAATTAPATGAG